MINKITRIMNQFIIDDLLSSRVYVYDREKKK